MYEIERKFKVHANNAPSVLAKLDAIGFKLTSKAKHKTLYISTKNPVIKLRSVITKVSEIKTKTEHFLIRRNMVHYTIKNNEYRELPYVQEEKISKFVVNSILEANDKKFLPSLSKIRSTFNVKNEEKGLTSNHLHLVTVDLDELQVIDDDNLFIEIKMLVDERSKKVEALRSINWVVEQLTPFIGQFPGDPYLKVIEADSKRL